MLGKGDGKKCGQRKKKNVLVGRYTRQGKSYLSGVSDTSIAVADSRLPVTILLIVL